MQIANKFEGGAINQNQQINGLLRQKCSLFLQNKLLWRALLINETHLPGAPKMSQTNFMISIQSFLQSVFIWAILGTIKKNDHFILHYTETKLNHFLLSLEKYTIGKFNKDMQADDFCSRSTNNFILKTNTAVLPQANHKLKACTLYLKITVGTCK